MIAIASYRYAAAFAPLAFLLSACSGEPEPTQAEKAAAATVPGAPPGAIDDVKAANAKASNVKESNDLLEFAYSYPREVAEIPKLADRLDKDRETKRDALVAESQSDRAMANKQGFPYRPHSHMQSWQRVTSTPRFLSLSSEIETYTGGAHGMQSFETLVWDRNRAVALKPLDLFASAEAFDGATRDAFCAGIKRAKTAKGIQLPTGETTFEQCPPASAQTVWLGSSDGRYLDRLTVAIAPYEIGPYAEGSYKINVPVDSALVRVVKPAFARDFLPVR